MNGQLCYNCGHTLELDYYWICNMKDGSQKLYVDVELEEVSEWVRFDVCNQCQAAQ